jgi:tRNA pseudouridine32 synthase/23S rRNA pseudouridine746 synthase
MVRLDNPELSPIHRLDRGTAGVVMFSTNPLYRNRYQALFRERKIEKTYEALAPPLSQLAFPHVRRTRIIRGDPFFLSQEVEGEPNSETIIEVIKEQPLYWHYRLHPQTGKKHQLRLHMAALGAPILDDPYYSKTDTKQKDDYNRPMALIARTLKFTDPISGTKHHFVSDRPIGNTI